MMNVADVRAQRIVVAAYVAIELSRLGVAVAAQKSVIAACLLIAFDGALLVALVRRHRWAWITLLVLQLVAEPIVLAIKAITFWSGMLDAAQILLLISPQMRKYIKGTDGVELAATDNG
jgi:hypothetical protein